MPVTKVPKSVVKEKITKERTIELREWGGMKAHDIAASIP